MDNYVIFSAARTGSTYLTGAVTKQIGCIDPNVFYGGELFKWDEYFMLSQPGTAGPGVMGELENDPTKLDGFDASQPQGESARIFLGDGGIAQRSIRTTSWSEVSPVCFRRSWEESQRRLTMLENSYYPWVFKIHPEHFDCLDMIRFNQLLERENTKVIFLYRSHLWDWFLSWVAVRQTGIFQQTQRDAEWNKPEITPQDISVDFMQIWYKAARSFLNISLSYRRWADHIIPYESFSGDPRRDAGSITGIDVFPETSHQVKLWDSEEKEKMIANLDEVKSIFRSYCKLLGFSGGRMYL